MMSGVSDLVLARNELARRIRATGDSEMIAAFERVSGHDVPVREAPPRPGDGVGAFANVDLSRRLLGWQTELSIDEAIASALAWSDRRQEVLGYE